LQRSREAEPRPYGAVGGARLHDFESST
jgi:hypothetical protein